MIYVFKMLYILSITHGYKGKKEKGTARVQISKSKLEIRKCCGLPKL